MTGFMGVSFGTKLSVPMMEALTAHQGLAEVKKKIHSNGQGEEWNSFEATLNSHELSG